jgi:hypothetical protein
MLYKDGVRQIVKDNIFTGIGMAGTYSFEIK